MAVVLESIAGTNSGGSSVGSVAATKPTGTAEGDLLVMFVTIDGGSDSVDTPSGWTAYVSSYESSAMIHGIFWLVAGASEPSTYTVSLASSTKEFAVHILRISGADTSSPFSGTSTVAGGSAETTHNFTAMTPSDDDCLIVGCLGFDGDDGGTHTISTGGASWTKQSQTGSSIGGGDGCQQSIYTHLQATAAAAPALAVDTSVADGGEKRELAVKPGTGTYQQEGFRWRDDDGSESAATWLETQDTNRTGPAQTTVRLRLLANLTGLARSDQFALQFRRVGDADSEWEDIS